MSDVLERAVNVTISPDIGSVSDSSSFSVNPGSTTTYKLTATNVDGDVSASVTVSVAPYVSAMTNITNTDGMGNSESGSLISGSNDSTNESADNSWLLDVLLFGLLAAAIPVIILLAKRKPSVASTTGARTSNQSWADKGTEIRTPHTTPATGAKFVTDDGEYVAVSGNIESLGRKDFHSMVTPSKADLISRQHLRVECENNEYYIEDSNSINGTKVNC